MCDHKYVKRQLTDKFEQQTILEKAIFLDMYYGLEIRVTYVKCLVYVEDRLNINEFL